MAENPDCIIVGGGPAGMVAGLLLACCGVKVVVLEKHGDFLRDFRGDTIHPSTLELLDQLGLMGEFEKIPYSKVFGASIPDRRGHDVRVVDLAGLKHPYPFIAMAPQWDFLSLLARAGEQEENFELRMNCEVTDVVIESGQVVGVQYRSETGEGQLRALLTIAADGRWSTVRRQAGLSLREYRVPVDVWWFRIKGSMQASNTLLPVFSPNRVFVLIPRGNYVQTAMLLKKGDDTKLRRQGIGEFRRQVTAAVPDLESAVQDLELEDLKLLEVLLNRANKWWRRGLLCIGDSAHAMSPVGGVGVNLAVQDAVCAARRLAVPLATGRITDRDVAAVQRRRELPTMVVQSVQRILHRGLVQILDSDSEVELPSAIGWVLRRIPQLARIPARLIGVGLLREKPPEPALVSGRQQT